MAILGSNAVPDASGPSTADRLNVQQYTVSGGDFTITAMHAYVWNNSGSFRLVVYDSTGAGGAPTTLVCTSANLSGVGGSLPGTDISGAPTVGTTLTNGVSYWIGIH